MATSPFLLWQIDRDRAADASLAVNVQAGLRSE
jgi:hypothetical protein